MITFQQAVKLSGLSGITVARAISIAKGNRHSWGRAQMPGLRSEKAGRAPNSPTMIRLRDLKRWLRERERFIKRYGYAAQRHPMVAAQKSAAMKVSWKRKRAIAPKDHPTK